MYSSTTHAIKVKVQPEFLEEQSAPDENHFVWGYHITIENRSPMAVQLLSRHWKIVDSAGIIHEVSGQGVVGEQPVLEPGDSFQYESGTPLTTPSGIMAGSYEMTTEEGEMLQISVPPFSLDSPYEQKIFH